jgi:hypothetical protein
MESPADAHSQTDGCQKRLACLQSNILKNAQGLVVYQEELVKDRRKRDERLQLTIWSG